MFNLDPGKLIVIGVVAIILLGPDKLPQFARQVGGAWRTFNDFRHRMESEVRSSMPDLPPTSEIARLARSPAALLHHLSTMPPEAEAEAEAEEAGAGEGAEGAGSAVTGQGEETSEGASVEEAPDGSFQPPVVPAAGEDGLPGFAAGNAGGGAVAGAGAGAARNGDSSDLDATAAPATNGRPASAPQPADVAVPADPTLN